MDNPYSKEVQNGLRLSALLINEGTSALQRVFNKQLSPKYKNLKHALSSNKSKMDKFYYGKPKLLDNIQHQLLYPANNKPESDNFDITLLTILFRNLICLPSPPSTTNWRDNPDDSDLSLSSDLVRIRTFRNTFYGHITTTAIEDSQFEIHWDRLSALLQRLNVSQTVIDKWKTECMTEHHIQEFKQKFEKLMARDVEDMQALMASTKCLLEKCEQNLDHKLSKVQDSVSEIKKENNDYNAAREKNLSSLLLVLSALPVGMSQLILQNSQTKDALIEAFESFTSVILNRIGTVEDSLVSTIKESEVKDSEMDCPPLSIHVKTLLTSDANAFKILILNQPDLEKISHKNRLSHTIGCGSWDVILDLNHCSRTPSGLFNGITSQLAKFKDFKVITYKDYCRVTDDDKETIAKGMRTLWILCNGCFDTDCEEPVRFGGTVSEVTPLLKSILSKLLVLKPVLVLNVILGNDTKRNHIQKTCSCIADACEYAESRINFEDSLLAHICLHEEFKEMTPDNVMDLRQEKYMLSCNQLISVFSDSFPIETKCEQHFYPGESNWCSVSSEAMTKLNPYLVLYHRDIGQKYFTGKSHTEIEKAYQEIPLNFLKGNVLTVEGLYLQEKCQVYIVRKDMRNVCETIENNLEDVMVWSQRNQGCYTISHDASGGGTTTAQYLLYTLREKYPCVLVKKINENLVGLLKDLYLESKKPLMIVVDDHRYEQNDISSLLRSLQNQYIKCLVVYIKRAPENSEMHTDEYGNSKNRQNYYFISSKLKDDEDKVAFKKLFGQIKKRIDTNKVFLFGLYAFVEEYARLNELIRGCMENMTEEQKTVLSIVYFIEEYGGVSTPVKLLNNLITSVHQKTFVERLGAGSDLIQLDKAEANARPIHRCVFKPLVDLLKESASMQDILKKFIEGLFSMFSKDSFSKDESMQLWIQLFIKRDIGSHFTMLIKDVEKYFCESPEDNDSEDYVVQTLWKFTRLYEEINKEQHPRALYARYLFYQVDNEKEGIVQIVKAVGLLTTHSITHTGSNDQTLITIYGSMFKAKAYRTFEKFLRNKDVDGGISAAIEDYQEAANAFSLAQQLNLNIRPMTFSANHASVQAFLGEAKARSSLLALCFGHKCKHNHEEYQKFLNETNHSFLRESEKRVLEILDQLVIAIRLDKVRDNHPGKTSTEILELKFKLLRMRYDQSITKAKLIRNLNEDVPCDVGSLVRLTAATLKEGQVSGHGRCNWEDLSEEDLELIISATDKRIAKHMLNVNYSDMIKAMQMLRQRSNAKRYKKYNLDYAMECAKQWHIKWPNDPSSSFNYGCLKFVKGVETKKVAGMLLIQEGIDLLSKCSELYSSNPSGKSTMNTLIFAIGTGAGLEKLVSYKAVQGKGQLYRFYGRQIGKNTVCVKLTEDSKPIENLKAKLFLDQDVKKSDANRQPNLQFNLALRMKHPFIDINVERVPVVA